MSDEYKEVYEKLNWIDKLLMWIVKDNINNIILLLVEKYGLDENELRELIKMELSEEQQVELNKAVCYINRLYYGGVLGKKGAIEED